eukprot:TRINITY_DN8451_c0_g1_i10.p3 TRINITY_DN8451_c0_g1~~TRINITY_DN8451_c0_g1_i10.p3  ORF type:complete len:100 (+),score=11.83 TRINITY_DN8451_c0_g1_i10:365-664(+)
MCSGLLLFLLSSKVLTFHQPICIVVFHRHFSLVSWSLSLQRLSLNAVRSLGHRLWCRGCDLDVDIIHRTSPGQRCSVNTSREKCKHPAECSVNTQQSAV